jgi:hypothetical protein
MNQLCTEVLERITSYIHADELLPVSHVCREWYHLVVLKLPLRSKPTYRSITSIDLLDYYRVDTPLNDRFIEKIIRETDNYDFYHQYLSYWHQSKKSCSELVDDHRYRTVHGLMNVKLMEKYAHSYAHLIPNVIPLITLEHQGASIKDKRLLDEYKSLISPSLIDCAMLYGNIPLLEMACSNAFNVDYKRRTAYMYANCSYDVIDYMVTKGCVDYPLYCSHYDSGSMYNKDAVTYIVDNYDIMKQYLTKDDYRDVFQSEHITSEQATKLIQYIGHDEMPNDLDCQPDIAVVMEPYLSTNAKLRYCECGILTSKKLTTVTIYSYNIHRILEHYGTVYTIKNAPLLTEDNTSKKKSPVIERYLNDPIKFIKKYNTLKNKWAGKIIHPDIYKHIVVQTWSDEHEYIGLITDDLHKLAFNPNIGNPLIGHCNLNDPTLYNRRWTTYELNSLLKMKRVDIITKHQVMFDAKHVYEYIKYDLDGAGLSFNQHFIGVKFSVPKYDFTTVPKSILDKIELLVDRRYNEACVRWVRDRRSSYYRDDERILKAIGTDLYVDLHTLHWHKVTKEIIRTLVRCACRPSGVMARSKLIDITSEAIEDGSLNNDIKYMMTTMLRDRPESILKCNRKIFEQFKYCLDNRLRRAIENILYSNA